MPNSDHGERPVRSLGTQDSLDLPVYRRRPLPLADLRGRFVIAAGVIEATSQSLVSFALAGIQDGGHEGMVFWAGYRDGDWSCFLQVIVPDADHGPGYVSASRTAVGATARAARSQQLGILAQVHSHPGGDARHSDGDDDLVLMPFEGMLSIVLPRFGMEFRHMTDARVHQFQDGRWVLCSSESVAHQIVTLIPQVDLRIGRWPTC
jgi:proteasome lid subunit RPN8/RPN11